MLFAGCVSEPAEDRIGAGDAVAGDAEVVLRLKVPGDIVPPAATRAMSYADERAISIDPDKIWVLFFKVVGATETFTEIRQVDDLEVEATSVSTYNFTINVSPTPLGEQTRLVLLANITDAEAAAIENSGASSYADVTAQLDRSVSQRLSFDDTEGFIPMWGQTKPLKIGAGSNTETVYMLRSIARIDVGIGQMAPAPKDVEDGENPYNETEGSLYQWDGLGKDGLPIPFVLQSVHVVRPSDGYRVMPVLGNVTTDYKAVAPSLPVGGVQQVSVANSEANFAYTGGDITNGLYTARSIYVPEADVVMNDKGTVGDANHEERMALVVGGSYNGGDTSYYRVDFAHGENLQNVLRNHLYSFSIQGVKGQGYPTVEEAYKSIATNLVIEVLDWDEEIYDEIYFDGIYYFAIDRRQFIFGPTPGETLEMNIRTNFEHLDFSRDDVRNGGQPNHIKLVWDEDPSKPQADKFISDRGYELTLIKDPNPDPMGGNHFILRVYNPNPNIGLPPRQNTEVFWTIFGGRLNIRFEIDQENDPDGWESFEHGQHDFVMPEGTEPGQLPVEVVSTAAPRTVVITDDATGDELYRFEEEHLVVNDPNAWITLTGRPLDGDQNYYKYEGEVVVKTYKLLTPSDPPTRSATITITWGSNPLQPEYKEIKYHITQEAPYLNIQRDVIYVQRPAVVKSIRKEAVQVFTNIRLGDLVPVIQESGAPDIVMAASGLENRGDPRNPRYLSFVVDIDMANELSLEGVFRVESNNTTDYGVLPPDRVKIMVPPVTQVFRMFWYRASFDGGATYPWQVTDFMTDFTEVNPDLNGDTEYIFPWHTTNIAFGAESTVGVEADPVNTVLGNATMGAVTQEAITSLANPVYKWEVTLDNREYSNLQTYKLGVRSTLLDALGNHVMQESFTFRQGRQVWKSEDRDNFATTDGEVGHDGEWSGLFDGDLGSNANIRWSADVSFAGTHSNWMTIGATQNKAGGMTYGPALSLDVDDRVFEPRQVPMSETEPWNYMTNNTTFNMDVDEWTELNPGPASRTATITFTNDDYGGTKLGAERLDPITVKQWAKTLKATSVSMSIGYVQGVPHVPGPASYVFPSTGNSPMFYATTNIPGFSLKLYDVTDPGNPQLISETVYNNSHPITPITNGEPRQSLPISVPNIGLQNPSTEPRMLQFVLSIPGFGLTYQDECDANLNFGIWEQKGAPPPIPATGIPAPPGTLGVTASGQLTLKGSNHYAGNPTIANTASPFGGLSSEPVYVVYFKWGSLIATSSDVATADAFDESDVVWAPAGYDLAGLKGRIASASGNGKWAQILAASGSSFPAMSESTGYGDPCKLADGGAFSSYRMPGNSNQMPGSPQMLSVSIAAWGPSASTSIYSKIYGGDGRAMLFTGQRDATAGATNPALTTGAIGSCYGYYWSTYNNGSNPTAIFVNGAWNGNGNSAYNLNNAYAVRCVN